MTRIAELYGVETANTEADWFATSDAQQCPYLNRKCLKNRKSEPELTIGTCTMHSGENKRPVIICPFRLTERNLIFQDALPLLTLHEPGNEYRIIPEVQLPGGNVDYCVVSVNQRSGKVIDFVGVEIQTLDTTGTVWPERQRFLRSQGIEVKDSDAKSTKPFGMNWKMTAKTILVQMHHKIQTFEHCGKHLVLAVQQPLMEYMQAEFEFSHLQEPLLGNSMHFHSYDLLETERQVYKLALGRRWSTDADGISKCLGLGVSGKVELDKILELLNRKLSQSKALFTTHLPVASSVSDAAKEQ